MVEFSEAASAADSVSVGGSSLWPCCCCPDDRIATRSCCTSRETEKVLSVSMIATHESLPPRDDGIIAVAVKR